MVFGKINYALVAGTMASLGSFFGKFASLNGIESAILLKHELMTRVVCLIAMVICNGMVWTFFVKALHSKGGSLKATVVSAATNYFISALLGFLIFNEATTMLWWAGTFLVLSGLILVSMNTNEETPMKVE